MLKVPPHQVAGHQAAEGNLGPLIDGAGRFFKPLQDHGRGSKEVGFYRSFWSNFQRHRMVPVVEHLVIQDVVASLCRPSVIDVKIGSRTWYPGASDEYVDKCVEKDETSTSLKLGLGFQACRCIKMKNRGCGSLGGILSADQVRNSGAVLELKRWFEKQTCFHFYSSSLLLMYGWDETEGARPVMASVKRVDFAHVVNGEGIIDHNFLGGLCSFIKFVEDVLENVDGSVPREDKLGSTA